ncbi:hypothetical protein KCP78_00340 [Salmonella enterica subsp. enterica]|nr:hypothetical protein KCP78_00340 [Salmonella enterica subsp. enterica]
MNPRAFFFTPPALAGKIEKASSATSVVMWWRWQPRWTPFLSGRRRILCASISAGSSASYIVYAPLLAGNGDYCLRRTADVPDCGVW